MTLQEIHLNFKFLLDKMDSLNYPNFLPEEIDLILNKAQDRIIKQRYGKTNLSRTSFEESQKRTEDLKTLVKTAILTPEAYDTSNISVYSRYFILPEDHWFIVQERVKIRFDYCNDYEYPYDDLELTEEYVEVRPIQHLEFDKIISDPFKQPDTTKVLRLMANDKVEIIYSPDSTLVEYRLRYIKQPQKIDISNNDNTELPDHLHQELIDTALVIALESIESNRLKTFIPTIDNTKE